LLLGTVVAAAELVAGDNRLGAWTWSQARQPTSGTNGGQTTPNTAKNISYWQVRPSPTDYQPDMQVLSKLATPYECRIGDLVTDIDPPRLRGRAPGSPHTHAVAFLPPRQPPAQTQLRQVVDHLDVAWVTVAIASTNHLIR
jgi:hypothetical protein